MINIDQTDRRIIQILRNHGRITYQELGDAIGLSGPGAFQRVKRLEEANVITGYAATLDESALGLPLFALLEIIPAAGPGRSPLSRSTRAMTSVELLDGGVVMFGRFKDLAELADHAEALRRTGNQVRVRIGRPDAPAGST